MIYHILNGDGLAESFDLEGEIVVCREALIVGDLKAKNLNELWKVRAEFIKNSYGAGDYFEKVKGEFDKLNNLKPTDEVNLWFGNEAFCQVNLWFILSFAVDKNLSVYRVFPDSEGWSCSFKQLARCFENRRKLSNDNLYLGEQLWKALCFQDLESLKKLGEIESVIFPRLKEVCQALIERQTRPREILREINNKGETDFSKIFLQFKEKAGVYGFGDLQVKSLLADL